MNFYENANIDLNSASSVSKLLNNGNKLLTVVISGFGYNLDMPIFYYLLKELKKFDTDILKISFGYDQDKHFLNLEEEDQDTIFDKDINNIAKFIKSSEYEKIIFIGKSLGSTACYKLLKDINIYNKAVATIWITPGTYAKNMSNFILETTIKSLIIYGEGDKYSSILDIENLQNTDNVSLYPISNANHSLEVDDLPSSIMILKQVISRISFYIKSLL